MAKLAIKGHATRGKEVIEILEMLGGKISRECGYEDGFDTHYVYFIDTNENSFIDRVLLNAINLTWFSIFTLEEFLEKFPYKVGDKVLYKIYGIHSKIKSMLWNKEKEQVFYRLESNKLFVATSDELKPIYPYKEETMDKASKTIFDANAQCCDIMNHLIKEETMEENIKEKCDLINFNSHYIFDFADKVELILKDDWEVKNEDGRTYVVRKQQTYPKTYNECWKILDAGEEEVLFNGATASEEVLFDSFIKLKRCRDAYWKIAGDWEPNLDSKQHKFAISNVGNKISFEVYGEYNSILCFPTEEIRDAFYENFKDLIEQCKELL